MKVFHHQITRGHMSVSLKIKIIQRKPLGNDEFGREIPILLAHGQASEIEAGWVVGINKVRKKGTITD